MAEYNDRGEEIPDPTPVEVPLNLRRPLSLQDEMRRFIRTELSQQASAKGDESFEEADDFEVDDEEEFITQYELTEMQEESRMPVDRDSRDLDRRKEDVGKAQQGREGDGARVDSQRPSGDEAVAGKDVGAVVQGSDPAGRPAPRGAGS